MDKTGTDRQAPADKPVALDEDRLDQLGTGGANGAMSGPDAGRALRPGLPAGFQDGDDIILR